MNKKGFTLLEFISSMSLFLMVVVLIWGFAGRTVNSVRMLSVHNELFEIGESTERILKRHLEGNIELKYVCSEENKYISYEDFSESTIRALFFQEKFYSTATKNYEKAYRVLNIKKDTKKILYQKNIASPFVPLYSIGGYDMATHIESVHLKKIKPDVIRLTLELVKQDVRYIKEVNVYLKSKTKI